MTAPRQPDHPDDHSMSFGDHLEDLRRRILWAIAVPVPVAIVVFVFSDPLLKLLYRPLDSILATLNMPRQLQALGPAEVLVVQLTLSLIAAAVVSAPWILWQAWLFVKPGLYTHERRFVYFLVPGSFVLTVTGLALMYFVMLPLMLRMLIVFGASLHMNGPVTAPDPRITAALAASPEIPVRLHDPEKPAAGDVWLRWPAMEMYAAVEPADAAAGGTAPEIVPVPAPAGPMIAQQFRLTTYINFVLVLMLGVAIAFQMPLVILLMGWLGLVTEKELRAKRKYAFFACAVVAAVVTPADAMSMIMMLIPLAALYELSILLLILVPASRVAEGTLLKRRHGGT